jgi:uncharacterized protein (TIGR00288 family)
MISPNNTPRENIALLIDAENAPSAKIEFIIAELAAYGVVNIRRAYGNWKAPKLVGWEGILHEYAIQPIQQFDMVKGKNAADMALLVDAMDILYTKSVGTFCLVSSDCDFTPLILRLRAEGKQVIGFGGQNTPEPFRNSCTRFLLLDEDPASKALRKGKANPGQLKGDTKLINVLRKAVEMSAQEDGWAHLGMVGQHIANQGPFDSRNYGFARLSELFQAIDLFETKREASESGVVFLARDRKRAKAGPAAAAVAPAAPQAPQAPVGPAAAQAE